MTTRLIIDPRESLPAVQDEYGPWKASFESWFTLMPANTARAYRQAWKSLLAHTGKAPWEIRRYDVTGWVETMTRGKISPSTIQQRLAGISSFFQFLNETSGIKADNPASGKSLRPKRRRYAGSRFLSVDQIRQLLAAIPSETPQGSRDFALMLAYLFTGRRNSEIRTLQWGDIEPDNFRIYYRWSGKGKTRRDEMAKPVFSAICNHLKITGRLEGMQKGEFLFAPLSDNATRLPNVCAQTWDPNRAISMHQVQNLLKLYCSKAGLPELRVHDLRHTAAMLRTQIGDDVRKVSDFLAHSNIAITQTYLHDLEGRADDSWKTVEKLLGINKSVHQPDRTTKRAGFEKKMEKTTNKAGKTGTGGNHERRTKTVAIDRGRNARPGSSKIAREFTFAGANSRKPTDEARGIEAGNSPRGAQPAGNLPGDGISRGKNPRH